MTPGRGGELLRFLERHQLVLLGFLVFLLALSLRLSYLAHTEFDQPVRADARKYVTYALNLINHGVYSQALSDAPVPDSQVTPGYPLFLAAIIKMSGSHGQAYNNILFIQALLGAATAVLVLLIGWRCLPRPLAVAAGLLTALSPHLISLGALLLTETLFTFLLAAALLALVLARGCQRLWPYLLAGLVIGLACLVRPALLLFPLLALPLLLTGQAAVSRKLIAGAVLGGVLICWLPWSAWSRLAVSVDSGQPGLAISSFVFGSYPDLVYRDPRLRGFPYREDPQYEAMVGDAATGLRVVGQRAMARPWRYLHWYVLGKPVMFWSWSILVGQGDIHVYPVKGSWYQKSRLAEASRSVMRVFHPLLLMAGLLATALLLVRLWRRQLSEADWPLLLMAGLLIYFTAVHAALGPLPRYSIPLRPELYLVACAGLLQVGLWARQLMGHLRRAVRLNPS